jgi:hypothetical protein
MNKGSITRVVTFTKIKGKHLHMKLGMNDIIGVLQKKNGNPNSSLDFNDYQERHQI